MRGLAGVRVLAVDDDEDILASVADALRFLGCKIATARDLSGARSSIDRAWPDVLVCDWNLDGERSADFLRQLRDRYPHVGRILMTASPREEWARALADGVAHVAVEKPFDLEDLADVVARVARQPRL